MLRRLERFSIWGEIARGNELFLFGFSIWGENSEKNGFFLKFQGSCAILLCCVIGNLGEYNDCVCHLLRQEVWC